MYETEGAAPVQSDAPTLVEQFGGTLRTTADADCPLTDLLAQRLHRMDGRGSGTYLVSVQPQEPCHQANVSVPDLDQCIRAAGDATAMSIEIQWREDGVLETYAVGRGTDQREPGTVTWSPDRSRTVPRDEVFTASQAHAVLLQWCRDRTVANGLSLRRVWMPITSATPWTEIEIGITDRGVAPKLVKRFGGWISGLTQHARPITEVLRRSLHRLDGDDFGTLLIWVQPGTPQDLDDLDDLDVATLDEYIQSAGASEAMLVEVRRRESDGVLRQYALGRDVDKSGTSTVSWASGHSETVPSNEVFTAEEAHPVYLTWCWDQTIPHGYRLRLLGI